jgi:SAM-dependent methyltransferase
MSALTDDIARQYERWVYPRPVLDLHEYKAQRRCSANPSAQHLAFWPDRDYPQGLQILSAGCGANQAAAIAFENPTARVLGIDVSASSLAHEELLKSKYQLTNLELAQLPIEDVPTLKRDFDLIAVTGVLHHMADPLEGARILGSRLKPEGVMSVMLYGRHGRVGVEMLRGLFGSLGLRQDAASLEIVKDVIARLPPDHPVHPLLTADDARFDAGLVDLFLNARERSYTVGECLTFVSEAGLAFQGWVDNGPYYPELQFKIGSPIYDAICRLPDPQIWAAMELLRPNDMFTHHFTACRVTRSRRQYEMDFMGAAFRDYVPSWANGWRLVENGGRMMIQRGSAAIPLGGPQVHFAKSVDGARTLGAILAEVGDPDGRQFGREFWRVLWRAGMMLFRIPAAG